MINPFQGHLALQKQESQYFQVTALYVWILSSSPHTLHPWSSVTTLTIKDFYRQIMIWRITIVIYPLNPHKKVLQYIKFSIPGFTPDIWKSLELYV